MQQKLKIITLAIALVTLGIMGRDLAYKKRYCEQMIANTYKLVFALNLPHKVDGEYSIQTCLDGRIGPTY